ncbi:family 78 glycoside hydrolase catalytic domain [Clostridium facile]|uniref:alpha-L-rhamnosidase n=1 Tax=Clostridium facile TaxID=2763035 RepID=A0ABR7IN00_9CLOT|nr:family 78 glycoside hydrolase catalytic domain [Clostridium facile]
MKKSRRLLAVLLAAAITATTLTPLNAFAATNGEMDIDSLQVSSLNQPLGIDKTPTFSWQLGSNEYGKGQSAYRIIVASTEENAKAHKGDVWDSEQIQSEDNYDVLYAGPALASKTKYYWAVEVWDEDKNSIGWSDVSTFETGILNQDEWKGEWIGINGTDMTFDGANWIWRRNGSGFSGVPAGHQYFRKTFTVNTEKEISSVYVGVTADDEYSLYVNGEKVGENGGTDSWKNGKLFEIGKQINKDGNNVIAIDAFNSTNGYAGALSKVEVSYTDGTKDTFVTDDSWKVSETEPVEGWTSADFDDSQWLVPDQVVKYGEAPWGKGVEPSPEDAAFAATVLREEFATEEGKEIKNARAYVAGLGFFEMKINGQLPDDSVMNPANTQYTQTVLYRTFDVTNLLKKGNNAIGIELGNSFYNETCSVWNWQSAAWRDDPKLRMELDIEYTDGTHQTITTDNETWKATKDGPITTNSIYYGETYDARKELTGYDQANYNEEGWAPAQEMKAPAGALTAQVMEPIRRTKSITLSQDQVKKLDNGSYVLYVPEMLAGWIKLNMHNAEPGQKVTITYGEKLNSDGTVQKLGGKDGVNSGWWPKAYNQQDNYICKGGETETFEPKFSYKGYQYVQIDNYPGELKAEDIVCYRTSNDMEITGHFESSNELINHLHDMMMTTMSNNMQGKPTDTPVWEKNGWLGDANVALQTMSYNYGYENMLTQFIETMEDCQDELGNVPNMVPTQGWGNDNTVVWNSIFVFGVDQMWDTYGIESYIEEQYPAMRELALKDIEYSKSNGWTWSDGQLADWVSPMGQGDENSGLQYSESPNEGSGIAGTGFAYRLLSVMADLADKLNKPEDAAEYREAMANIYEAFNAKFYRPEQQIYETTTWSNIGPHRSKYRQTSNLVPLAFGLVPEEYKEGVLLNLVKDIRDKNYHLDTGCVGTELILPVLSENGYADVAYKILEQTSYPSWGYMANHKGGTSLWEMWEDTSRSLGHYFLGTYDEWLFKGIGGIKDMKDGYKTFTIEPMVGGTQDYANVSVDTVRGTITSNWTWDGNNATFDITVPVGSTATVILPSDSVDKVAVGKGVEGILNSEAKDGKTYLTVTSGSYQFSTSVVKDENAVDTLDLKIAINQANGLDQIDYDADAWATFRAVIDEAEALVNDSTADQTAIDTMTEKVLAAIEEVKTHINQSRQALKELVANAESPNPVAHPQEYIDAFNNALAAAEEACGDINKTNEELDQLKANLEKAIADLDANKYENYAQNGAVDARSTYESPDWGWGKAFLVDGDRKNLTEKGEYTGYSSDVGEVRTKDHEEWVSVDLGEVQKINSVVFYAPTQSPSTPGTCYGFPKTFDIQVSTNGQDWTTVASEKDYPVPSYGPIVFSFDEVDAKYVKLYAYNLNPKVTDFGYYYLQLSEMEVYNSPNVETPKPPVESNKDILNKVIAYAENAANSEEFNNVIKDVQESFNEALAAAQKVAENNAATQEEVDAAWKALMTEIHKLGFVKGDITSLEQLVATAKEFDLSKYVEAGQAEFKEALAAAEALIADKDNAMQAEIETAETNLLNAMLNLRYKADKSILEEVVAKANDVDANAYTAESYAVLSAAVAEANDVLANENATQEEVDTAVANVQAAMSGLVAVDNNTAEDNTVDNTTQTGQESTTTKANAAKTGDVAPIAGLALLSIAGASVIALRKKHNK